MTIEFGDMVSVVIPAYNAGKYLGRALDSVLGQSQPVYEVILVDDGSEDNSRVLAEEYCKRDKRVKYVRQDNAGVSAARNKGIKLAKGNWVAFLDADDEWLIDKLKLQMGVLQRNKELNWVAGNYYRCDCRNGCRRELMRKDVPKLKATQLEELLQGRGYFDDLLKVWQCHTIGWTGTMLIKREVLLEAGGFTVGLKRMNDLDMWLRVGYIAGPIGYVANPVAIYHMGVAGSIIKKHFAAEKIVEFIEKHRSLAVQYGKQEAFEAWVITLIRYWVRYMQQYGRGREMRGLLRQYRGLVNNHYYRSKMIASYFPRVALLYDRMRHNEQ